jgi:hypothetical protein
MIKPATFFGTPWWAGVLWVRGDEDWITVRGLLRKRRVALDRVVAVPRGQTVLWCDPHGRMRRRGIWFLGPGRAGTGSDPNYAQRHGLEQWFLDALKDQHGGGKRSAQHHSEDLLRAELQVALCGEQWAGRHHEDLYKLWSRRSAVLRAERDRRNRQR